MSRAGLWAAGLYALAAASVAIWESNQPPATGWITLPSLRTIGTAVMTFPVSAPLGMLGLQPPLANPWFAGLSIVVTTVIVYRVAVWLAGRFS